MLEAHSHRRHSCRLVALFCAITGCFLIYSLIQERLMTLGFGPRGAQERFRHSLLVILVNRLVAVAVAAAALALAGKGLRPAAPLALFAVPSAANVLGSASQYEALKYVSFPLQALAKCAKTVPVMVWGLLLGGRRYDSIDYICALTVTFGCGLFVLTGSIAAPQLRAAGGIAAAAAASKLDLLAAGGLASGGGGGGGSSGVHPWLIYGLLLLGAFLLFDGLTSTTQDKLFAQYDMHSCNQLLWVSAWSAGISFALLLVSGQLGPAVSFVSRHPSALGYILMLSAVSTAVQLFIFYTIQQYGALHFALIMTIRQFLSIVLSCLVFSHQLSAAQWIGTALVIGGLVARGMHRGGLDRTSAKIKQSPVKAGFPGGGPRGHKLPLSTIPVVEAGGRGDEEAPLLADDAKQAHSGSGGAAPGRNVVQLQASAGPPSGGDSVVALPGGAGRPMHSPKPSTATRRKAIEANSPLGSGSLAGLRQPPPHP